MDANTSDRLRTGTLTIAGRTFTVEQAGQLTLAAQDLSIGDGIVVQNAGTVGLNIRSTTQVADWTQLGKTYDGATGLSGRGPAPQADSHGGKSSGIARLKLRGTVDLLLWITKHGAWKLLTMAFTSLAVRQIWKSDPLT